MTTINYLTAYSKLFGDRICIAHTSKGACAVLAPYYNCNRELEDWLEDLERLFPSSDHQLICDNDYRYIRQIVDQIDNDQGLDEIPIDMLYGSGYQKTVWDELRKIPEGQTACYSEIADRIGDPKGARSVASACRTNPILILVPCHRVIMKNGEIGGYSGGLAMKRELLRREGIEI